MVKKGLSVERIIKPRTTGEAAANHDELGKECSLQMEQPVPRQQESGIPEVKTQVLEDQSILRKGERA